MYRRGQAPPGDFCLPRLTEEIQKAGAGGEKRKGIPRASYIQKDVENNGKLMVFMGTWYCIYIYINGGCSTSILVYWSVYVTRLCLSSLIFHPRMNPMMIPNANKHFFRAGEVRRRMPRARSPMAIMGIWSQSCKHTGQIYYLQYTPKHSLSIPTRWYPTVGNVGLAGQA